MPDRPLMESMNEQRTYAAPVQVGQVDNPPPVTEAMGLLERDAVRLTQLLDQLDKRLAPVMGEGRPFPSDDSCPAPGTSQLVTEVMALHARLDAELDRLSRMMERLEVG
jgi:hypothetical protein